MSAVTLSTGLLHALSRHFFLVDLMVYEFQAVILAGGRSGLYPLLVDCAKSMLPLANKPMLYYQLELLERSGISEAIVACDEKNVVEITKYVTEVYQGHILVSIHATNVEGTADVLRSLKDKIKTGFFVISGDVVTERSLHDLADVHRIRDSSVTMLLKEYKDTHLKEQRLKLRKLSKEVIHYFGLVWDEKDSRSRHAQVVLMKSASEDDRIGLSKRLLRKEPNMSLHTNLVDGHIYIFRRWVLDFLCFDERVKSHVSLRTDFIPFMVNHEIPEDYSLVKPETFMLADSMSSFHHNKKTHMKCHALVLPDSAYCSRANTLYGYSSMNHDLVTMPIASTTLWDRTPVSSKHKETIIGEFTQVDESASLKSCVIGAHCKILAGAKLNNSVIMNHCTIGVDAVIQNSIISNDCTIEDKCNLNDVQVASQSKISSGRYKNQAILASNF